MEWRNKEHYPDPTAAKAIANITRAWKPCVFICSPFAGDVELNTTKTQRYMRFAVEQDAIPFAPHLLYPQVLDENNPLEREMGVTFGLIWLGKCDELWVFGSTISEGMKREIARAERRGVPIKYFTEGCEEVHSS